MNTGQKIRDELTRMNTHAESYLDTVEDCIRNTVKSRHHDFAPGEQREYNILSGQGRRLYDNLRTKYDWSHEEAFVAGVNEFGVKSATELYMERVSGLR